jgi:hypothetical protein
MTESKEGATLINGVTRFAGILQSYVDTMEKKLRESEFAKGPMIE